MSFEVICQVCNIHNILKYKNKGYPKWVCRSCYTKQKWQNPSYRKKHEEADYSKVSEYWADETRRAELGSKISSLWEDKEYRKKQNDAKLSSIDKRRKSSKDVWSSVERRQLLSEKIKSIKNVPEEIVAQSRRSSKLWQDSAYSTRMRKLFSTKEYKSKLVIQSSEQLSKNAKEVWKRPGHADLYRTEEFRRKSSETNRIRWKTSREKLMRTFGSEAFKSKMASISASQPRVSSIQTILYSILDDLNVNYIPEHTIGPWSFDCFIPDHNLLIECQGEYWHSRPKTVGYDKAKATYIERYQDTALKCIWEHEFLCKDKVRDLLCYWLGLEDKIIDYDLKDLIIKEIDVQIAKLFVAKYHYAGTLGNNQVRYGAYLGDELIAVCVFGSITRKETATRLKIKHDEMKELTRFCIHPLYRKNNLASWMISKTVGKLKKSHPKLKCLVSFADNTFNHTGVIYKASGWKHDGKVAPSYWYAGQGGWVAHKKTLWNKAKQMQMKESEYVKKNGYIKVKGKQKERYLLWL